MVKAYRECAVCGHGWILRGAEEPEKCPQSRCRSRRWKTGTDRRKKSRPRRKGATK